MGMKPTESPAYLEWVASRPARVRDVLQRLDGWTAYRLQHDDGTYSGHYTLAAVEEPADDAEAPCTVKVQRFDELTGMPMWLVFGVDPDRLEAVGPAINESGLLRVGLVQ